MNTDDREPESGDKSLDQRIADIELADEKSLQTPTESPNLAPQSVAVFSSGNRWQRWLRSRKFWVVMAVGLFAILLVIAWFVPLTRFSMLNLIRVKGGLTITAVSTGDDSKIKNFTAIIDGKQYKADQSDILKVSGLSFGTHVVTISKTGFESYSHPQLVNFDPLFGLLRKGSSINNLTATLKSIGTPVSFVVKDALSDTPLTSGTFTLGDTTADVGNKGIVKLIVPPTDSPKVSIKATFGGRYLDKTIELDPKAANQSFSFVPAGKHYFVAKQNNIYNVLSTNLDGSDQKVFLAGTTQETASLLFAVSPSGKYAVMASTREGTRDDSGNVLQKLYRVDLSTGASEALDQGNFFTFYDWSGDVLAYSYGYKEPKATEYSRRLRSADVATKNLYDLGATTGAFNRVSLSNNSVIWLQSEAANQPTAANNPTLRMASTQGGNPKDLASQVAELRHIDNDTFLYQTADKKWLRLTISSNQVTDAAPPVQPDRIFLNITSPNNNKKQLVLDVVNGQATLSTRDETGKEQKLATGVGLGGPIRWVNETTVVYRVIGAETADYAVSTLGGTPKKIDNPQPSETAVVNYFRYY